MCRLRCLLRGHRAVCAGVVDENVKRRALSKEAVDGRQVGHVKDRGGSGASRLLNGYRGRFDFFARTRRESDLSSRLRKCRRQREADAPTGARYQRTARSEEHTSELQSLMRISYAVFCLKKKIKTQ